MKVIALRKRLVAAAAALAAVTGFAASAAPAPREEPPKDARVAWLAEHAVRLRSIDPEDEDFSDLAPLVRVLDGVRVVLLGEPSHGDGSSFLAKGRLIRFLHQRLGFDVLAFESGLYDCTKAWRLALSGEEPIAAISSGVFGIWTRSEQVLPTLEYVSAQAHAPRPLELTGFDSQLTGRASRDHLVDDLRRFVERRELPFAATTDWRGLLETLDRFVRGAYDAGQTPPPSPADQESYRARLALLAQEIAASADDSDRPDREGRFWQQVLASLAIDARSSWEIDRRRALERPDLFSMRDQQMGRNLVWLARERFAGRKIIVWAATFHNARRLATVEAGDPVLDKAYDRIEVMGEIVHRELGDEAYSLGFTAARGEAGSVFGKPWALDPPAAGSLEDLMERAGLENAWIDFRGIKRSRRSGGRWLRRPLVARPLGYQPMRADWTRVLDGMLFTRTMEPSRRRGPTVTGGERRSGVE